MYKAIIETDLYMDISDPIYEHTLEGYKHSKKRLEFN